MQFLLRPFLSSIQTSLILRKNVKFQLADFEMSRNPVVLSRCRCRIIAWCSTMDVTYSWRSCYTTFLYFEAWLIHRQHLHRLNNFQTRREHQRTGIQVSHNCGQSCTKMGKKNSVQSCNGWCMRTIRRVRRWVRDEVEVKERKIGGKGDYKEEKRSTLKRQDAASWWSKVCLLVGSILRTRPAPSVIGHHSIASH